jgi:hypothetical protein
MPTHFQTAYTPGTGPTTQALLCLQIATLKAQNMYIRALERLSDAKDQHIDRLATENEMKDDEIERSKYMSKAQERQIEIREEHIKCLMKRIGEIRGATE